MNAWKSHPTCQFRPMLTRRSSKLSQHSRGLEAYSCGSLGSIQQQVFLLGSVLFSHFLLHPWHHCCHSSHVPSIYFTGGPSDNDWTPHGKPAEAVLKKWWGVKDASCAVAGSAYGSAFLSPGDASESATAGRAWVAPSHDAVIEVCNLRSWQY